MPTYLSSSRYVTDTLKLQNSSFIITNLKILMKLLENIKKEY